MLSQPDGPDKGPPSPGASAKPTAPPGAVAKPCPPPVNPDSIPAELKAFDHFVVWRYERRPAKGEGEAEWTKVPKNPRTGRNAKSNDPSTWGTFDEALSVYQGGGYDGIGFVVHKKGEHPDPFVVFDLDKCRCPKTGQLDPWASKVVAAIASYTETTPSAKGVRIVARGSLPAGRRRIGNFEVYDDGRFVTLTGQHVEGTPRTVEHRQAQLA